MNEKLILKPVSSSGRFSSRVRLFLIPLLSISLLMAGPAYAVNDGSTGAAKVRRTSGKTSSTRYGLGTKSKTYNARKKPSTLNQQASPVNSKSGASPALAQSAAGVVKPEGKALVESVKNNVTVQKSGETGWNTVKGKESIESLDRIKTGAQSLARLKLEDGSKIILLQNSTAELENLSSLQKAIKLLRGRVRAIVKKIQTEGQFKIKTPIGVASVRGTEFEVEFREDNEEMEVEVISGQVGVSKLGDLAKEIMLRPGDTIRFGVEGDIGDPMQTGSVPFIRSEIRAEVQNTQVKNMILAQSAEESRSSDYQTGKSLLDVDGNRVRVEQYIMRPRTDQFKLVVLNERSTRFDYFTYLGTFNKDLPTDLSVALRQIGGKLGAEPEYYLEDYTMEMSNTIDTVQDVASGGHLVEIYFDGTNYILTDKDDPLNTKSIAAVTDLGNGTYEIYNPIKDTFSAVSAADLSEAQKIAVLDGGNYRNMAADDTYWKTRFNNYEYSINDNMKIRYIQKTSANILALDQDANFTHQPTTVASEYPSGSNLLHNRLSLYYDDSTTVIDNYIIDDEGNIADSSAFAGIGNSAEYQTELLKWNYQQKVKADEMDGREINIVVDPRIGTMSGLIQ